MSKLDNFLKGALIIVLYLNFWMILVWLWMMSLFYSAGLGYSLRDLKIFVPIIGILACAYSLNKLEEKKKELDESIIS